MAKTKEPPKPVIGIYPAPRPRRRGWHMIHMQVFTLRAFVLLMIFVYETTAAVDRWWEE